MKIGKRVFCKIYLLIIKRHVITKKNNTLETHIFLKYCTLNRGLTVRVYRTLCHEAVSDIDIYFAHHCLPLGSREFCSKTFCVCFLMFGFDDLLLGF